MQAEDWSAIATVVTCVVSCGAVLIYIGRSLGTLQSISQAVNVALAKTDRHETEINEIKVDLARVKTRQEDCENCP